MCCRGPLSVVTGQTMLPRVFDLNAESEEFTDMKNTITYLALSLCISVCVCACLYVCINACMNVNTCTKM